MRKLLALTIILLFIPLCRISAQTMEDTDRISLNVVLPEDDPMPEEAKKLLSSKMNQIVTNNGMADNSINERFVLTALVNVLSKDVVSGSPVKISEKIEIVFYIGDICENKLYGSISIIRNGTGLNENKALIAAMKSINVNDDKWRGFIDNAKNKIISYYDTNYELIIKNAWSLANSQSYDEAIYKLVQVPSVCQLGYAKCQDEIVKIYKNKIDFEGETLLNKAKYEWAKSPNAQGANSVTQLIVQINANASCQSEVKSLVDTIEKKLREDERRVWEFQMQQYRDKIAMQEKEFEARQETNEDLLKTARLVGTAWGVFQPRIRINRFTRFPFFF